MTIQTTQSRITYTGDNVSTAFNVPFEFFLNSDLTVIKQVTATGIQTTQVLGTDYNLSGAGVPSGGTLTKTTPLLTGEVYSIFLNPPINQQQHYVANSPFPSAAAEQSLDRLTQISQRLSDRISLAITAPDGDASAPASLPAASVRASQFLAFDVNGNPVVSSGTGTDAGLRADLANTTTAGKGNELISYRKTAAEIAQLVTPVNYFNPPGYVIRQVTNTSPAVTDLATGFQNSINAASSLDAEVFIKDANAISKPMLIKTTTTQSISFRGNGKSTALVMPLSVDIKQAPQNINCLFFNQNNNPHAEWTNMRFWSSVAYTGVGIYCVENGGADASGQCLFSARLENLFCDTPSTNGGFLTGATQNSMFDKLTYENQKGVLSITGVGNADNHYSNISLYNCYDHFFNQVADTNGSFITSIVGLHAYNHNRGRLIDVQNVNGFIALDVILEPVTAGLGNIGIAKFKNSTNVILGDQIAVARTGVPQCDIAYEVEGSTLKLHDCIIDAAIGIRISGVGAVYIELDNVTFTNSATACIQINGAASGTIRTRGCKFNDSQVTSILSSVGNSISWYSQGDEFLNAGLGGAAGSRNITLNTSGVVRIVNATIGRNNVSAVAAYFVDAAGSGTVEFIDVQIVGTPPIGFNTGAQAISMDGLTGTWVPSTGGNTTYTLQQGRYTVVQNVVNFWGRLAINLIGTGSQTVVQGLPFNAGATHYGVGNIPFFQNSATALASLGLTVAPGSNAFTVRTLGAIGVSTGTANVLQNGTDIIFSGSYPLA